MRSFADPNTFGGGLNRVPQEDARKNAAQAKARELHISAIAKRALEIWRGSVFSEEQEIEAAKAAFQEWRKDTDTNDIVLDDVIWKMQQMRAEEVKKMR